MINVSTEYFNSINQQMRNQMDFIVGMGIENTEMKNNSHYLDNGHLDYSNVSGLKSLYVANKIYVTAETNMYLLDGNHEIVPSENRQFQGFVSSEMSGTDFMFVSPPTITIADDVTTKGYDLIGFTIQFDRENNDYATDFDIEYYHGTNLIGTTNVIDNTQIKYIDDVERQGITKIVVKFYKTHNFNRRIRVTGQGCHRGVPLPCFIMEERT